MLLNEYKFPRAICRVLSDDFLGYFDLYGGGRRSENEIMFHAVAKDVPAGVKIAEARLVTVRLRVIDLEEDAAAASTSQDALLKTRIKRIANDAFAQGGLLTQADIALILGESRRTICRHVKEIQESECITVPTRGTMKDIGSGTSHKAKIVELHLQDYEYTEIMRRTHHSEESIMRYIKGFSRVALLHMKGHTLREIRLITGNSDRVIRDYLDLYERYTQDDEMREKIEEMAASAMGGKKNNRHSEPELEGEPSAGVPG